MFSSQNEQDNRYYGKLSGLPMLEPSSVEEAKEMTAEAFDLSEQLGEPVILRTTTRINHSTARDLGPVTPAGHQGGHFAKKTPSTSYACRRSPGSCTSELLENLEAGRRPWPKTSPYNIETGRRFLGHHLQRGQLRLRRPTRSKDLGHADERVSVPADGIFPPAAGENDRLPKRPAKKCWWWKRANPFMEEAVKAVAQEAGLTLPIRGKAEDLFSRLYEFDPAMVRKVMAALFRRAAHPGQPPDLSDVPEIAQRPPNLCAGCSHRATFYAVKKPPRAWRPSTPRISAATPWASCRRLAMGDFLICMGSSTVSTACGFSKATDKKVISFIGDSTFFHSGMTGLATPFSTTTTSPWSSWTTAPRP
jgi:indolepyruvate ferredoxin oxidoreductase alpha subunit